MPRVLCPVSAAAPAAVIGHGHGNGNGSGHGHEYGRGSRHGFGFGPGNRPRHGRDERPGYNLAMVQPAGDSAHHDLEQRWWWPGMAGLAAAWIAGVHALLWWLDRFGAPRVPWGDENTYLASAARLLAGDPGWWPEPLWPPLYPQFLAGVLFLGGGDVVWVWVLQSALLVTTALVLGDLARRLTDSRAAGWTAAAMTVGYPPLVAFSHYLWPEILHLFLFVAVVWLLAGRPGSAVRNAIAGIALGLALLTKSLLLPFVPVLAVAAVWGLRPRQALIRAGLVLVLAGVTVAPIVIANTTRTGQPTIANSATFNLWVGLNDVGRDSFEHDVVWPEYRRWTDSADTDAERDLILRRKIRELVAERGIVSVVCDQLSKQYFRLFDAGCYLTDQLPGGAAQRQSGAGYVDAGPVLSSVVTVLTLGSLLALYVAAPVGLIVGGCRRCRWARLLAAFVGYNLLLFLWLHVKTRYRIQMLPAAFVGVGCLVAWIEAGFRPRVTAPRAGAAALIVGLLLYFALA